MWLFGLYLAQFVGQQVPQQQSFGGVSHQVAVFAHDFDFLHLVAVIWLEDHSGSCGEVPHDHLEERRQTDGLRVKQGPLETPDYIVPTVLHLYLAQAHVGHLKLVLVDGSPQAAVENLHSPAQSSLPAHKREINRIK